MANIKTKRKRIKFASDNVAGACPEVLDAILKANEGDSTPYGNDQISTDLQNKFSEIFEKEVIVFPITSGTAANALALATMTPSFGNIYCHRLSHINLDECGAPEFYTGGGKLVTLKGVMGKITSDELDQSIGGKGIVHHTQPSSVSITQVCETGEVYQLDAYISNDVWLRNARHANSMGKKLSDGLSKHNDIKIAYPTEANEVFAKFPREKIEHLNSEGYKMNEDELDQSIGGKGIVHHTQPSSVSITQVCETGEVYQLEEIKKIAEVTHKHNLNLHMDGARFANALVALNTTPAEMTWKSGVDVLSFGATKNGCLAAEAIIFFKKELVGNTAFLMKRAGHLLSKMRFVSAQLEGYLNNDVWLKNAKHANEMGKKLSESLNKLNDIELAYPTEANEVFAKFPRHMIENLNTNGYEMNDEDFEGNAVRLVTAWNTQQKDIDHLLETIQKNN